ncbi:tyrosine-type recombinase/integrase [Nonomuraea rhodomycinica]|uniref:tyrosine-type recombinase/integrase n=1 Tax=Nonomuraea rhodomycinica TaxID=1712872 RepID=UPI001C375BAE
MAKLGYEHLRRHDLRHTGLTWMADAGGPVHVLWKIAGHGPLTTTQRYLPLDSNSLVAASNALSAHLNQGWSQAPGGVDDQHDRGEKQKDRPTWAFTQADRPCFTVGTTGFEPATP